MDSQRAWATKGVSLHEQACDLIVDAVRSAGLKVGADVAISLDPAASSFHTAKGYNLEKSGAGVKSTYELNELYAKWIDTYPIVSIEDGLAEDDWQGFAEHTAALGERVQIVGDNLYLTSTISIKRGVKEKSTNAVLIKLNQIGTVTETIEAINLCREAGWGFVISHRSGETEDVFIADFAVAMAGGQIKTGSVSRGERIAKYNRPLEIEREIGAEAEFRNPFAKFSSHSSERNR